MEKFGQYLLRNSIVSQEQLNEALQCQVIFGGRLGTNLVELGYLTLDDLARLLSRRSGIPSASVEELEELPRETLAALPRSLIDKFKIIPIRIEAKTLHVAVCDPTDLRSMDEIAFSTGMRVKPYLLPELRMFYLLERHYGIKREIRYIRLGRTLSRGKYAGALAGATETLTAANGSAAADGSAQMQELESKGFRPLRQGEELTDERTHAAQIESMTPPAGMPRVPATALSLTPAASLSPSLSPSPTSPALVPEALEPTVLGVLDDTHLEPIEPIGPLPSADAPPAHPPPSSPEEASELRTFLQSASDRELVAGAALRLARSHFATVAIFIVNKGLVLGWRAAGGALDRQPIESMMLPASADSILKAPASSGTQFQGPVPKSGLNERLMAGLGRTFPVTAVVMPVLLKNRVVNLVYADNGAEGVNAAAAGYLQLLTRDIGGAYERIILAKKKNSAETAPGG